MFLPKLASGGGMDRSPWGNFWFTPVSRLTNSGQRVSPEQAMRLSAVYACVNLLAKTFAVLPFSLYKPAANGGRAPITDHWAYKLLAKRPNQWQNPFEWRQMCMGHLALRGNVYNEIYGDGSGAITDLIPRHPDRVVPEVMPNGDYRYRYTQPDGTMRIIPRGQMWHMRWLSLDGIVGLNPIEYMRETIGIGLAAQDFGARFFANDGSPPGWIELPGKWKDDAAALAFREKWKAAQSGRRHGGTAVLEGGMKYHDIAVKNSDAQFLETRQFTVADIARMFGTPPQMIGDLEGAQVGNSEQQSLNYVVFTMTPLTAGWEASIEFSLLIDEDGLIPGYDMKALLRGDQAARASYYGKMFGLGSMNSNDIRICEGYNPIPEGNHYFVPVNLQLLEVDMEPSSMPDPLIPGQDVPAPPGTNDQPNTGDGEGGGQPGEDRESRVVALAAAAAGRVARREWALVSEAWRKGGTEAVVAAYTRHAAFVAGCLSVGMPAARQYCKVRIAALAPNITQEDFEVLAHCQLEQLALKGNSYAR